MTDAVQLRGWFEPERLHVRLGEPFSIELVVRNEGERDAYVFVPRGRADGLEISVLEGGDHELSGLMSEPEPGLVGENRLPPGETYRQAFPLSSWLSLREPGRFVVECRITVDAADRSVAEGSRTAVAVEVGSTLDVTVAGAGGEQ